MLQSAHSGESKEAGRLLSLSHAGFFILRTPLLPIEELIAFSAGLTTAPTSQLDRSPERQEMALTSDIRLLRSRLRALIDRPEILQALFIASPSLQTGIEYWKHNPDSKKGLQAERALVRYFGRMSVRPTPFGMFSGCSVGKLDHERDTYALALKPRSQYRIHCRLDFEYLSALAQAMQRVPTIETEVRYWPNSSLWRVADGWHYVETRHEGSRRSHHLVKLESDPYLDAVIERARTGAMISDLVKALLATQGPVSVSEDEAKEYVLQLVRGTDLLVSTLSPVVTGTPPLDDIIRQMESLHSGSTFAQSLRTIRTSMRQLEAKGIAGLTDDYNIVTSELRKLPAHIDIARLYQVDMSKPVDHLLLGKTVIAEIIRGVGVLCCLAETREPEDLKAFREAFSARYERAKVPLLEALDEECGVGFGRRAKLSVSPLILGLGLDGDDELRQADLEVSVQGRLLRRLFEDIHSSATEVELDISKIRLQEINTASLANAFYISGVLASASIEAIHAGDFEIYLQGGEGPSGARLLGRFCHTDPEIERGVREHLRQEEALDPDAIYAEVVHLPEGSVGNILYRPVMRDFEIPYLGRSGAPQDRCLPVQDLVVGIEDDTIVLYSKRLNRRVLPRLTNAHGFQNPYLSPLYRFLCSLQHQHGASVPGLSWGPLEAMDFLPRVRTGRLVLSLARWRLSDKEIDAIKQNEGSERFLAVQELRRHRRLPRWVALTEKTGTFFPVDLENALSIDAFAHVLKRSSRGTLIEMYPSPDRLCVSSAEGHFYHEFIVPFVQNRRLRSFEPSSRVKGGANRLATTSVSRQNRVFAPGSDWLYVKLYGGSANLDEILISTVFPLVRRISAAGAATRWFFIRYSDPHKHLRIRFNGSPSRLRDEVLPLIFESFNPLLASAKIWKIQFDTYEREIERYGGLDGVRAAENVFFADSEAVLEILQELQGDEGLDARWRIGLLGIHRLLADCDLGQNSKRTALEAWRDRLQGIGSNNNTKVRERLSGRFRAERSKLELLLEDSPASKKEWEWAKQVIERRSVRIREAIQTLEWLTKGQLVTRTELAGSYVHMHVNRLFRSEQRAHEFVLYDFLLRLYNSSAARDARFGRITQSHSE